MKRTVRKQHFSYTKMELLALALNVCIFVFEIIATIVRLVEADGYFGVKYYTQDSNLLMLIVSGAMIVCLLQPFHSLRMIPHTLEMTTLSAIRMQNESVSSVGDSVRNPLPRESPKN